MEKIIARISNGTSMEVRIREYEFKGKVYVDVRKFYLDMPEGARFKDSENSPAEFFKPTGKGISLTPDQWKKVLPHLPKE